MVRTVWNPLQPSPRQKYRKTGKPFFASAVESRSGRRKRLKIWSIFWFSGRETLSEQAGSGHLLQELETYCGSQQGKLAVCTVQGLDSVPSFNLLTQAGPLCPCGGKGVNNGQIISKG